MQRLLDATAACCCCRHLLLDLLRLPSLGANMSSLLPSPPGAAAAVEPCLLRAFCAADATAFCRAAWDLHTHAYSAQGAGCRPSAQEAQAVLHTAPTPLGRVGCQEHGLDNLQARVPPSAT